MGLFDFYKEEDSILENVGNFVKGIFPIVGKSNKIELIGKPEILKKSVHNFKDEMEAKEKGATYGHRVKFKTRAFDKDGQTIGQKTNYVTVPKMTKRDTFIVEGNEYQVTNQLRLDPAVYTFKDNSGTVRSQFNTSIGMSFKIVIKPGKDIFLIKAGGSSFDLYPLIKLLGGTDSQMQSAWGKNIAQINQQKTKAISLEKLYKKLYNKTAKDAGEVKEGLIEYFNRPSMKLETNKLTLSLSDDRITARVLIRAGEKIINVASGKEKEDERDNLVFQTFQGPSDLLKHRLDHFQNKIKKKLEYKVDYAKDPLRIVGGSTLTSPIKTFFTSTELSNPTEQTNFLHMLAAKRKITRMGEGGIPDVNQITTKARGIHTSQYGFLDPYQTPESSMVGIVTSLTNGTGKGKDNRLNTSVFDLKKKKPTTITPLKMWNSKVAPFDSIERLKHSKTKMVDVLHKGKVVKVKPDEIDFLKTNNGFYSPLVSLIPFQNSNQGNRTEMASRQMAQHTFIKDKEHPLVSVLGSADKSMEQIIGNEFGGAIIAPKDGVIKKITDDEITINYNDGEKALTPLYNNFHLNQKSFLQHDVKMKAGQKFKKGDLIADSNATKDGKMAFGTNLRVAYMPYKGLNFEDGTIVSEKASEKLTSKHMHTFEIEPSSEDKVDKKKFKASFPTLFTSTQLNNIDENGLVKKGSILKKGDPIMLWLKKRAIRPEDIKLGSVSKKLNNPYSDGSKVWSYDFDALVVRVIDGKTKKVRVTTEEVLRVGDKVSGRHGNKGIITKILPNEEMPKDKDGNPVDIILNPQGVISRINPSQLLENALGKVAHKRGKSISVKNFDSKNANWDYVLSEMKKEGIKEKDELFDPTTGHSLGEINTGYQYVLKLDQPVRKKIAARGVGSSYTADMQPNRGDDGGQSLGSMEIYGLLAHGAKDILRETSSIKGDKNDEFWHKFQAGQPYTLPAKQSFITDKLMAHTKVLGIDLQKQGQHLVPVPFTSKEIKASSSGEVKNSRMLKSKGSKIEAETSGLFDPKTFGAAGIDGKNWGHIQLDSKIVNPLFEDSVRSLLGVTKTTFNDIVSNKMYLSKDNTFKKIEENADFDRSDVVGLGMDGIEKSLSRINPNEAIPMLRKKLKQTKSISEKNKINKKMKYLNGLSKLKAKDASIYMMKDVPVLPPTLRPAIATPDGNMIVSDMNYSYKDVIDTNNALKEDREMALGSEDKLKEQLYNSVKALQGFGAPITYGKDFKGVAGIISGNRNKNGFFQGKVVKKRQEMSGRSTITPNPKLGIDEMVLPEKVAWKMFEPKIKREMSRFYDSVTIRKHLEEKNEIARRFLNKVMGDNYVIANRAPTLHKGSVLAFKTSLTKKDAIQIPNLVVGPFNADFDGDSVDCDIFIRNTITKTVQKCHISEFPHLSEKTKNKEKTTEYKVGIENEVLSFNHETKVWEWKAVERFSIHRFLTNYEVFYKSGRVLKSSNDSSLFVVPKDKLIPERTKPEDAIDLLSPNPNKVILNDFIKEINILKYNDTEKRRGKHLEKIILNNDMGWFLGMMVGDGWINIESKAERTWQQVMLANTHPGVINKYEQILKNLFTDIVITKIEAQHLFEGHDSYSEKRTFSCEDLAWFLYKETGKMARGKKLPSFFLQTSEAFRWGLLSGLIDSDGYFGWSNSKGKKPQFNAKYDTKSKDLKDDICMLAYSLGLRTSITESRGGYIICFRTHDVYNNISKFVLTQKSKNEALEKLSVTKLKFDQTDYLPVTADICNYISKKYYEIFKETGKKSATSKYTSWKRNAKTFKMCRHSVKVAFKDLELSNEEVDGIDELKSILDSGITYDLVKEIHKQDNLKTMWDLTIPGSYTFLTSDGIAVFDTMALHVPVTDDAQKEASKMTPSSVLLNPRNSGLFFSPSQEMVLGMYQGTKKGGKDTKLKYNSISAALLDLKKIKDYKNLVTINNIKAPLGLHWINSKLPKKYQNYKIVYEKGTIKKLMAKVVEETPDKFAEVINAFKDVGNTMSTGGGNSISITDFSDFLPTKNKLVNEFDKKFETITKSKLDDNTKSINKKMLMVDYGDKIEAEQRSYFDKNPNNSVGNMILSGSRGTMGQVRQSMGAPLLMRDATMKPMDVPIKNSYIEGQTVMENLLAAPSARFGAVMKVSSVSEPGAFAKSLAAAKMSGVVTEYDCGQKKIKMVPVKDSINRFLSKDILTFKRNTLVTRQVQQSLEKKNIKEVPIRSQFDCLAKKGVCTLCYGADEYSQPVTKGMNVGILDAQSLSEPLTQGSMKIFHTGGLVTKMEAQQELKTTNKNKALKEVGFDRIRQIFNVPNSISQHGILSDRDGIVKSAKNESSGGAKITLNDGHEFLSPSPEILVTPGEKIKRGDILTGGTLRPQDIAETQGIDKARSYMMNEMENAYNDMGAGGHKRMYESIVAEQTSFGEILETNHPELMEGDIIKTSKIREEIAKGYEIKYKTIIQSIDRIPLLDTPDSNLLQDMNFRELSNKLKSNISFGRKSHIENTISPIASYVIGNFGRDSEGNKVDFY